MAHRVQVFDDLMRPSGSHMLRSPNAAGQAAYEGASGNT